MSVALCNSTSVLQFSTWNIQYSFVNALSHEAESAKSDKGI